LKPVEIPSEFYRCDAFVTAKYDSAADAELLSFAVQQVKHLAHA
jgi:hypothetical protein